MRILGTSVYLQDDYKKGKCKCCRGVIKKDEEHFVLSYRKEEWSRWTSNDRVHRKCIKKYIKKQKDSLDKIAKW